MKTLIPVLLFCTSMAVSPIAPASCKQDHVGPCNDTTISAGSANGEQVISLVLVSTLVYLLVRKLTKKAKLHATVNSVDSTRPVMKINVIKF